MSRRTEVPQAQEPPYPGRDLFVNRDQARGDFSLFPVISAELDAIRVADRRLLEDRYLYAGTYVRGLQGENSSPYDHRDANYVNSRVRDAIEDRARELGTDTSRIA